MTNVYEKITVELPEEKTIALPQIKDDLTKIKGVGSGTSEKLNVRKIYTYQHLAEITPEKLSEAPGIGVATASKIIEEAKRLLGGIQGDNNVKAPEQLKEEPVIAKENKKEAVVHEEIKVETYEVAETEVEEELLQEIQVEEKPIKTVQKPWFSEKFNRSRLTASNPAILERRSKESKVEIEEIEEIKEVEIEKIEEYQEEFPDQFENNATVEPFESEAPFLEEVIPREENFNAPIYSEPEVQKAPVVSEILEDTIILEVEVSKVPEVQNVPEVPEIIEVPETIEIPTRPSAPNRREELMIELAESLKELGYYAIPRRIEALNPFFQRVDYIGLKLASVNAFSKLIVLVPIKLCDLEGTILIHEGKIDYKAYSKVRDSDLVSTARQHADDLLRTKDRMFEEVVNGENFREFFEKYLQVRFRAEKSAKNKKLYLVSGQIQYKVLIEPILLTKIPAKCMEKSILFPYQRKTNLHVVDRSNLGHLLRFLEKKYNLIESRAKKTNSIETYQTADAKFRSNLKMASLPFLVYSVVLLVIYFSQLYFLLRLLNSIGVAAIGIYVFAVAYFYFRFYKTKKELTTEFETPYYLQNAQFSETDLLIVKEEFTTEQMAQFGYECFGKDSDSKVLKEIEKNSIKESVVAKQREQVAPDLFELDSDREDSSVAEAPKNDVKYSSFLED